MSTTDTLRQDWADYVKAIAIYVMVLGHSELYNQDIRLFIYSFHMPVFFLLTGFFEKGIGERSFKERMVKAIKTMIVPYFVFNVFGMTYCWYGIIRHPELYNNISGIHLITDGIVGMFTFQIHQTDYSYLPNGVLWFLAALFVCKFVFSITIEFFRFKKIYCGLFFVILISISAFFIIKKWAMFGIGPALLAMPIYYTGYLLKKYQVIDKITPNVAIILFISSFVLLLYFAPINGRPDMCAVKYGNNVVLFYINAIIGSIMCISFARCLRNISYLAYIGKHTLAILCMHVFFVCVGKQIVYLLAFCSKETLFFSIIVSIFGVVFSLVLGNIIEKKYPWMFGKF